MRRISGLAEKEILGHLAVIGGQKVDRSELVERLLVAGIVLEGQRRVAGCCSPMDDFQIHVPGTWLGLSDRKCAELETSGKFLCAPSVAAEHKRAAADGLESGARAGRVTDRIANAVVVVG